jgi:hypothetical protein
MTDSLFMFQSAHFKLRLSYLSTHQSLTGLINCFIAYCKGILRDSLPFRYRVRLGMERVPLRAHITGPPFSNWSLV